MYRLATMMALAAFVFGFGLVRPLEADDTKDTQKGDAKFVWKAAEGGLMEVKLGKLAMEHAANADVRKFGERMVADHGKANQELQRIADKKGYKFPTDLSKNDQDRFDKLKDLQGADFDATYIKTMVKDHEADVEEFTQASKESKDEDVKAFAARTLPVIHDHLNLAKKVASNLNSKDKP